MDPKKSGNPAVSPATKRGRQDGISKLTGSATFSAGGVSIKVSIPSDGGSAEGTSNFSAGGATGSSILSTAINKSVTQNGSNYECTTLPKATFNSDYTVAIRYTINSAPRTLQATVRGSSVTLNNSPTVTLT